jgi:hypothetical protein
MSGACSRCYNGVAPQNQSRSIFHLLHLPLFPPQQLQSAASVTPRYVTKNKELLEVAKLEEELARERERHWQTHSMLLRILGEQLANKGA